MRIALRRWVVVLVSGAIVVVATGAAAAEPAPPTPTPAAPGAVAPSAPPPVAPAVSPDARLGPGPDTTPTPDTGGVQGRPEEGSPGFFDLGGRVGAAINDWFRDLVTSALDPVLDLLGRTGLATPDIAGQGRVRELWGISAGMANGFFVVLVIVAGAIVMGHETVQTSYSAKEIAPRIVFGLVAANASLAVAGLAIDLANAFSQAFLGQGVGPANATGTMRSLVLAGLSGGGTFLVFIGLAVAVLALLLLAVYVIRVAMVVVLVAGAPLALACHALPQTEGLAQLWWRAFAACLGIQVAQSLVLVAALRVFFASGGRAALGLSVGGSLVDLLVVVSLLWVLLRIPTWAGRAVFSRRGGSTFRLVKGFVVYKVLRRVGSAVAL